MLDVEGRKDSPLELTTTVQSSAWSVVLTSTRSLTLSEVRLIRKLLAVNKKPDIRDRRTPRDNSW